MFSNTGPFSSVMYVALYSQTMNPCSKAACRQNLYK